MTYEQDLQLFRSTFPAGSDRGTNHPDIDSLVWELEKTVEQNPEKWGWLAKACVVCGTSGCVSWDQVDGYRCEDHR